MVSVIIPTYNRASLVVEALESVFAQTYKEHEVIVVDDGSTDNTREILEPYLHRIQYTWQENQGISAARNRGILLSHGRYIAFLDSDDRWLPSKLEKQVDYMNTHPKVGLVCCHVWRYEIGKETRRERRPHGFPRDFNELLTGPNHIPTSTVLVRRECLETVGMFDETLPPLEDWDLWLRIARRSAIHILEEVLSENRKHSQNTTNDLLKVYEGYWRFYAKVLKLHRSAIPDLNFFKDREASFRYLLGTTYLRRKKMRKALYHIAGSLKTRWDVGMYFDKKNLFSTKIGYFLKPYGAFAVSLLGALVSWAIPAWRSR